MTRLGYTQASVATVSEHVMQKATRACLLACACLHSAEPKAVCHCDIRFANVLWDPQLLGRSGVCTFLPLEGDE